MRRPYQAEFRVSGKSGDTPSRAQADQVAGGPESSSVFVMRRSRKGLASLTAAIAAKSAFN
jgi:hypothetical protein